MSKRKIDINTEDVELVKLYGWQADIAKMVSEHESLRSEEAYQDMPDWAINKALSIRVVLPKQSGHTYLANYLAARFPAILVYHKNDHLEELTDKIELHDDSETISMYEMFYALFKPDVQTPSPELLEMNNRLSTNKLIVVDNSLRVPQQVKDYIFQIAQGPIVLLGH